MDRRTFIVISASALAAGCGSAPPGAAVVNMTVEGKAGMNPGSGGDKPVTLAVLHLRSLDAFNAADALALQNPATAVAADLVAAEQVVVTPGSTQQKSVAVASGAGFVAIVAGFINPSGKNTKASLPVQPGDTLNVTVTLDGSGLTVA